MNALEHWNEKGLNPIQTAIYKFCQVLARLFKINMHFMWGYDTPVEQIEEN